MESLADEFEPKAQRKDGETLGVHTSGTSEPVAELVQDFCELKVPLWAIIDNGWIEQVFAC